MKSSATLLVLLVACVFGSLMLRQRVLFFPSHHVVGESLGSGPASILSREQPAPNKLVLVVRFDDIKAVARHHVPWLPVSLLLAGTWNNVEALAEYRGSLEIFGAEYDEVVPARHARRLAGSLPQAQFHLIHGTHDWSGQRAVRFRNP